MRLGVRAAQDRVGEFAQRKVVKLAFVSLFGMGELAVAKFSTLEMIPCCGGASARISRPLGALNVRRSWQVERAAAEECGRETGDGPST